MKRLRRVMLFIVTLALVFMNMGGTVFATEPPAGNAAGEVAGNAAGEAAGEAAAAPTPAELEEQEAQKAAELPVQTNELDGWAQGPATHGEAAIVMEVGTGAVLYAKNIDEHEFPASITKILTALVALENAQLTDTVTFSHDCVAFLKAGDSSVGLKEGNQITLEQALYATLLASANEAAYAVGENVAVNAGHDYNWFIEQMNTRCRELGGENSNFVNTNGLHDENHYTCARDMALIGRELFKHPDFFRIVQTLDYAIPASATSEEHIFQQKHKMMRPENSNYYQYVIGGKTGFTSNALSTLVTMADNGGMQVVCVVLRTHGANIYPDTRGLLDYAFNNFEKVNVSDFEDSKDVGGVIEGQDGGYVVVPKDFKTGKLKMELTPDGGQSNGASLAYTYKDNPVGSARVTLSESYVDKHSAKVKDVKDAAEADAKKQEADEQKQMLVGLGSVVLIIVVLIFSVLLIDRKRRRSRHRRR